jgi:uncharacterized protein with HEPN domain
MTPDEIVVLDIIRAARLAIEFTQNMDKAEFLDDIKTQSAVLHQLMVMGEAVKRLSPEYRNEHFHYSLESDGWDAGCPHSRV